jgi:hypothetical protein
MSKTKAEPLWKFERTVVIEANLRLVDRKEDIHFEPALVGGLLIIDSFGTRHCSKIAFD